MTKDATASSEYSEYYAAALSEPLAWFHLDSDFLDDPKIMRLGYDYGWPYIGLYVGLMARLAAEDGHIFDVSGEFGWMVLQSRLSLVGKPIDLGALKEFVGILAELGLIDRDLYGESGKVASERMMREVENCAAKTASNRARAESMRAGKERKKQQV